MRAFVLVEVFLFPLTLSVVASAQQPAAQAGAPRPLQKGKLAVINTAVLQEKIAEYKAKIDALNKQFEARSKELQSVADRINALETTIKTQSQTLTPARVAEMTEELEQMKRDYRHKSEDLQADGERALGQTLSPIKEKLNKFLQDYTAKRGIVVLIDLANAFEANAVLWYDQRADVTNDFIAEYNKVNAAPAGAAAPPKP